MRLIIRHPYLTTAVLLLVAVFLAVGVLDYADTHLDTWEYGPGVGLASLVVIPGGILDFLMRGYSESHARAHDYPAHIYATLGSWIFWMIALFPLIWLARRLTNWLRREFAKNGRANAR